MKQWIGPMQSKDSLNIHLHDLEKNDGTIDWGDYRIAYYISKNKEKSTNNEDSLVISSHENQLVFGVSDGAGGHPKGREAAITITSEIHKWSHKKELGNSALLDVIERANDAVIEMKAGAHATVAVASITNDEFRSFSVGDSEIIYWNSQGNELYTNIPQSEIGYRIQAGDLNQDESLDDPARSSVNNLIGDPAVRIEVASKMKVKKGHTILVGSDGLFDNLSHQSLGELICSGSFEKSIEQLNLLCTEQGEDWKKDDDISYILIRKIKA